MAILCRPQKARKTVFRTMQALLMTHPMRIRRLRLMKACPPKSRSWKKNLLTQSLRKMPVLKILHLQTRSAVI